MDPNLLKRKSEGDSFERRIKRTSSSDSTSLQGSLPSSSNSVQMLGGASTTAYASSSEGDSKLAHSSYLSSFPIRAVSASSRHQSFDGEFFGSQTSKKGGFYPQSYYYQDVEASRSNSTSPVSPPLSPSSSPTPMRQDTPPNTPPPLTSNPSTSSSTASSSYYYHPHQVPTESEAFLYPPSNQSQYNYAQSEQSRSNYSLQYYQFPQQYSQLQSSSNSNFSSQSASFSGNSASYSSNRNYSIDMHSMSKLKVPQLKSLLGQYHLKKSGKKQELIDRLASYLQSTGTPFSPSSVINNWPRKNNREIKPHIDVADIEIGDNRTPYTQADGQKLLPSAASSDGGLSFTMPPPIHSDGQKHPTVVCRFGASPILVDESCRKVDLSKEMSKHFRVYYQRNPVDSKQCLHHFYFAPRTTLHLTLIQHRELFAYSGEAYNPSPLCPLCSGHAETWLWDLRRKSSKQEPNPLLKWISQHFSIDHHIQSMFGGKSWGNSQCLARICNSGHLSISLTESSHGSRSHQGPSTYFVGAFSPRRTDTHPCAHVDLEDVTGMDSVLGLSHGSGFERMHTPIETLRFDEMSSLGRVDEPGDVALWL